MAWWVLIKRIVRRRSGSFVSQSIAIVVKYLSHIEDGWWERGNVGRESSRTGQFMRALMTIVADEAMFWVASACTCQEIKIHSTESSQGFTP